MSLMPSDFKYAVRLLVKRPWFTLLTVAMLAGGLAISDRGNFSKSRENKYW